MRILKMTLTTMCLAACATAMPPKELTDARASYSQAERGAAAKYKPDQLHEAKTALDQAEQMFKDDPSSERTRNYAYVANRRAQFAEVEGQTAQSIESKGQEMNQTNQTQAAGLTKAQAQLVSAQAQLGMTQVALGAEQKAHADADARAKEALSKLALASVPVKEEARGMIITLPGSVLFASGKSTLLASSQAKLTQVADALKDEEGHKITVEGYTDSRGSDSSNQALSQRRADSVRAYLVAGGVPAAQIDAQGFGSTKPVAENTSAEGRANNRRVEIVVKPIEPM